MAKRKIKSRREREPLISKLRKLSPSYLKRKLSPSRPPRPPLSNNISNLNRNEILSYHEFLKVRDKSLNRQKNETLSPSASMILKNLRDVQSKAYRDVQRQERLRRERNAISQASNLLKTPNVFSKDNPLRLDFDVTGVSDDNILKSKNIFEELPENRIMRTNRPNILQTKESGNNLIF